MLLSKIHLTIPSDLAKEVIRLAGKFIRECKEIGKTLNLIDILIASTCIINDLILVTYNIKHHFIKDLRFKIMEDKYEYKKNIPLFNYPYSDSDFWNSSN